MYESMTKHPEQAWSPHWQTSVKGRPLPHLLSSAGMHCLLFLLQGQQQDRRKKTYCVWGQIRPEEVDSLALVFEALGAQRP